MDAIDKDRRKYITAGAAGGFMAAAAVVPEVGLAQVTTLNGVAMLRGGDFSSQDSVELHYHTSPGDGGGGYFYRDAADSSTADNGGTVIVDSAGNRFKRRHSGTIYSDWFGPTGTTTEVTTALSNFFKYVVENSYSGIIRGGEYTVNNFLVHYTDPDHSNVNDKVEVSFRFSTTGGKAIFDYQGSAIDFFISSHYTIDCEISDIQINANSQIASPVNVRNQKTENNGGKIHISRVHVNDVFQSSQSTNASGITVLGEFSQVRIEDCSVFSVGRTGAAGECVGIAITDFPGIASVTGCDIRDVSSPNGVNADGLSIFGTAVENVNTFLGTRAVVQNNIFANCQGRSVKLQISDALVSGNQFKLVNQATASQANVIDCQSNNGNIVDNSVKILGTVPMGSSFSIFTLQNYRNTHDKVSYVSNNRVYTEVAIPYFCLYISEYRRCSAEVHHNQVSGNTVSNFFRFGTNDINNLVGATISITANTFASGWKLLSLQNNIDFGDKLFLVIRDNNNTNHSLLAETVDQSRASFACRDFVIANNANCVDRVNWTFDMDDLKNGNCFFTGSQVVTNSPAGVGTYFHVVTEGFLQRCTRYSDGLEFRRTTHNKSTWYGWF